MKENVKSVIVLTALCLVVAVLLSVTNFYTAPIIEANKASQAVGSLAVVMPDAQGFEEITPLPDDTPATVKNVYKETSGLGYVVVLATTSQYSSDDMGITVGIGTDGKICGVTLTSYAESKDFGVDTYPQTYVGADSALGGIDTVAGVTYSSTAFKNAITDAFTILFEVGDVAEGEKSEEQLIEEVMPMALPGCADTLGKAQVVEGTLIDGATAAYDAVNGVGHIYVMDNSGTTVVAGVNAFGERKIYDLEGNDITDSCAALVEKIAAVPSIESENLESNSKLIADFFDPEAVLTPIHSTGTFDSLVGGFIVESAEGTQYVFISNYFGFSEPMKFIVILDENGTVVSAKCKSALIQEAEYYGANPLTDETGYKEGLVGLTETDDSILVSGATITTTAARKSLDSAFAAFKTVKEAA